MKLKAFCLALLLGRVAVMAAIPTNVFSNIVGYVNRGFLPGDNFVWESLALHQPVSEFNYAGCARGGHVKRPGFILSRWLTVSTIAPLAMP